MNSPKIAAASFAVLLAASSVAAQDFSINNNIVQGYTNNMVNTTVRESLLGIDSSRRGPPPRGGPARPQVRPGPGPARGGVAASTRYRPSPAVTARVRQQFVAFVAQRSGRGAGAQIGAELTRKDYLRLWAADVAGDGLHANDVADALASYWVQNWLIAHGGTNASRAQISAARAQTADLLGHSPAFVRLNEAQKQEMAEIFIYNQIVQGMVYSGAVKRGDIGMRRQLANAAVARFRNEMGVDLMRLSLTPQGFSPRA